MRIRNEEKMKYEKGMKKSKKERKEKECVEEETKKKKKKKKRKEEKEKWRIFRLSDGPSTKGVTSNAIYM